MAKAPIILPVQPKDWNGSHVCMIDFSVTPPAFQINSAPSLSEVFKLAFFTRDCQLGQLLISVKIDQTFTAGAFIIIFCLSIIGSCVFILIFMICAYVHAKTNS